jgi:UDP-N-acetylglucosamine 2-epimerase
MRVLTVVGNRPQFIKAAPLGAALRSAGIDEVLVHTGQHYDRDLSDIFFEELGIAPPEVSLGLRTADPAAMIGPLKEIVAREQPDWVLVYGDTNTTVAGAEAAGSIPIAHIEAGLRSFDLSMPEERNRIAVDRISALLLCPDERAAEQLRDEGVPGRSVVVGDVMADATRLFAPLARERSDVLARLGLEPGGYTVVTIHREANVDPKRLARIASALDRLDGPLVFPAHPRTAGVLDTIPHSFSTIDPLGYLDFSALASQARLILTDSGGLQKEAYWYGVPCVTLRENTEWVDTIAAGANVLVGSDPDAILSAATHATMPNERPVLYGDGHASERIAAALYASSP